MGAAMGRSTAETATAMGRGMARAGGAFGNPMGSAMDTALNASMAWWDLMLRMQRASLASLSVYSPGSETRISASQPQRAAGATVLPVGEERLNVAAKTVLGETTRIRRRVVEAPVEQEVTLRDERVVVERRPASGAEAPQGRVLTETIIEMSESHQVPQVWKSVHVAEEVVLKREVTERKERVRETLKRDVVEVEQDHEGRATVEAEGRALVPAEPAPRVQAEAVRRVAETLAEPEAGERRRDGAKDQPGRKG